MCTNTRKRVALVVLGLIVASSTLVAQQYYDFKVGQLYYKITDTTNHEVAVVSENSGYPHYNSYNEPAGAIAIPATVVNGSNTYSVTSIGYGAFSGCSGLTSINIPSSVTSIGSNAFSWCSGLTSINIPNSVTSIGEWAFSKCSGLTSINIPNSVTSIGERAFLDCSGLTAISIPSSVTSIGYGAFYGCSGLTSIAIPASCEASIATGALAGCTGLTSINIPSSVTSIGSNAFSGCSGLTSINIPSSITSIGYGAFSGCSRLTSISIPSSVTSIGGEAFYGCSGLTSITIPSSVTSIGSYAFSGCSGLTSINIPSSITKIEYRTFSGCSGLTSIAIPSSVTSIGSEAFYGCSELTSIVIPTSCEASIATGALAGCTGLTSITIPSSVTSIGYGALAGCTGLTSITIPSSVTSIGGNAFSGCSGLTSITIPNSVTSIEYGAFSGCSGLTSITIPSSVTSIGSWAFSGCSGLTSITIPNSVTSIEYGAFSGCSGLTSIAIPNIITSIKDSVFFGCSGLTSITIPNSVTSIENLAFSGCSGLTSITIPNSVTSIGERAFSGCSGLTAVAVGWQTPLRVDQSVFSGVTLGNVKLIVPFGKKNVYKTALVWKDFNPIVEQAPINYIVTYNQSVGGTFTLKNGSQYVISGSSVIEGTVLTVEATPAQDYRLDSVRVNDVRISGLSFTVTSSSIVEVYFSKPQYTISYSQSAGGTFKVKNGSQEVASGSIVDNGTILTIEATSAQGYKLDSIKVNGARISGLSFTVDSNSTVEAYFSKMKYTVTYTQPANGTLAVKNGSQEVASGSSIEYGTVLTFEARADEHYKFDSIRVNGARISGLSFTVTDNTNIEVFFGKQSYTVTYNSNMYSGKIEVTRGSEIVASGSSVEYGTQLTVKAIPNPGFEVKSLTINDQAIANNFVFSISEPIEIKAVFAPATTALDEAATKPLAIYPNPVAEVLYLSATARTIRIYDMYGTEVAHATDTNKVEVSHLPAGVYTVRADGMVAKMVKR